MKQNYTSLITLISLFLSVQLYSQTWSIQSNGLDLLYGSTQDLFGVNFIDQYNGFIAGCWGEILKTTDGGTNWTVSYSSDFVFHKVYFYDVNLGFAVGYYSKFLKTTNSGNSWSSSTIDVSNILYSVDFFNSVYGLISGANGKIYKTTDGGTSWNIQQPTYYDLYDVEIVDATTAFIVGDSGRILKTTNAGVSWSLLSSGVSVNLWGTSFVNKDYGFAVGLNGTILKTTNGGTNWISQTSGTTNHLIDVIFTDANNGTVVGWNGTILRTTDGGTNWVTQISNTTNPLRGVSFIDQNKGWTVGHSGIILNTIDGALPVELTSFTFKVSDAKVLLNWQTATEVNNYGFEIERRVKGIGNSEKWEKIAFVQGHGNSNSPKEYSFTDANPPSGKVKYRLKQIDFDGKYEYSPEQEVNVEAPANFVLEQNHPNPFNPETTISYQIPVSGFVTLKVFDLLGREITTLVNEFQQAGSYNSKFSIGNLPAGRQGFQLASSVYLYQLKSNGYTNTKKFVLMK